MTTLLSKLSDLERAATPGPWLNRSDCSEVTNDKTFAYYVPSGEDAALIAAMRNNFAALLKIAEAAVEWREETGPDSKLIDAVDELLALESATVAP